VFSCSITGGDYDLVSFSPRGTSKQYLNASCYEDPNERMMSIKSNNLWDLVGDSTRAEAGWGHAVAAATASNNKCKKALKGKGEYMGTAFTARDVMAIVDALGEEKLNYWGISYGTILGATLAGMFPDRMGRVVLDSVVNPTDYYEAYGGPTNIEDLDAVLRKIFEACVEAGPDGCPLADAGETADEIEKKFQTLMKELAESPMAWPEELVDAKLLVAGEYLDDSALRTIIFPATYSPQVYFMITSAIAGLLDGDLTAAAVLRQVTSHTDGMSEAMPSIYCSDKRTPRDTSVEAGKAWAREQGEKSMLMEKMSMHISHLSCNSWPFSAKEKYMGSFDLDTTASPFLIMSNTYDPVTPLSSARNLTDGFKGSALLEVKSFGHGSFVFPEAVSTCASEITARYFNEGVLPEDGTVCEASMTLPEILTFTLQKFLQAEIAAS
jgi:pimeloyl-ACP methyl ester carboxylesterase